MKFVKENLIVLKGLKTVVYLVIIYKKTWYLANKKTLMCIALVRTCLFHFLKHVLLRRMRKNEFNKIFVCLRGGHQYQFSFVETPRKFIIAKILVIIILIYY